MGNLSSRQMSEGIDGDLGRGLGMLIGEKVRSPGGWKLMMNLEVTDYEGGSIVEG
jgi:hypothetical protein